MTKIKGIASKWEYGGHYHNLDMSGIIEIGTGKIKVHNIFDKLPEFVKSADTIFCDPPCSKVNINTFYTKADRIDYQDSYEPFTKRFFEVIDEIKPKQIFVEVFKSNKERFIKEFSERYPYLEIYDSKYYNRDANKCWIIQCSNQPIDILPIQGMDEAKIIKYICEHIDFKCIYDPCIGQGLVGFYANMYGREFVGTELNKKRLAVLINRINTNKL